MDRSLPLQPNKPSSSDDPSQKCTSNIHNDDSLSQVQLTMTEESGDVDSCLTLEQQEQEKATEVKPEELGEVEPMVVRKSKSVSVSRDTRVFY